MSIKRFQLNLPSKMRCFLIPLRFTITMSSTKTWFLHPHQQNSNNIFYSCDRHVLPQSVLTNQLKVAVWHPFREHLAPQIRSTNIRFHPNYPWSYGCHLTNHTASYHKLDQSWGGTVSLVSGIFGNVCRQGVQNIPYREYFVPFARGVVSFPDHDFNRKCIR